MTGLHLGPSTAYQPTDRSVIEPNQNGRASGWPVLHGPPGHLDGTNPNPPAKTLPVPSHPLSRPPRLLPNPLAASYHRVRTRAAAATMGRASKGSRKGKKAWRANIKTDDVEEFFEQQTRDAHAGAAAIPSLPSDSLFFVDKPAAPASTSTAGETTKGHPRPPTPPLTLINLFCSESFVS
jgi:hypothetical protein